MVHEPDLLDQLTESQQQAVLHEVGPLLVLAGPGSGKTTVVTRRIARLMQGGVAPWSILALTFTNKAAGEMRERVRILVEGCDTRGLTVSTFHAFAARQLRIHADRFGRSPDFTIFDAADQKSAAQQAIIDAGLESWTDSHSFNDETEVIQFSNERLCLLVLNQWFFLLKSEKKNYQIHFQR